MRRNRHAAGARRQLLASVAAVMILALASGCAEKGPILLDVQYQAPEGAVAGGHKTVVGIGPFKDVRPTPQSQLGRRVIRDYVENELVVQGTVSDLVQKAMGDALTARGIAVKKAPAWDMDAATIKAEGVDILIGGEIQALWVDVLSQPLNVNTKVEVRLRIAAADVAGATIIRTLNLSSKVDRTDVAYSRDRVEGAVAEALSSAINQLLNDEEFKKQVH